MGSLQAYALLAARDTRGLWQRLLSVRIEIQFERLSFLEMLFANNLSVVRP